jgi:hypothetical protein
VALLLAAAIAVLTLLVLNRSSMRMQTPEREMDVSAWAVLLPSHAPPRIEPATAPPPIKQRNDGFPRRVREPRVAPIEALPPPSTAPHEAVSAPSEQNGVPPPLVLDGAVLRRAVTAVATEGSLAASASARLNLGPSSSAERLIDHVATAGKRDCLAPDPSASEPIVAAIVLVYRAARGKCAGQ